MLLLPHKDKILHEKIDVYGKIAFLIYILSHTSVCPHVLTQRVHRTNEYTLCCSCPTAL